MPVIRERIPTSDVPVLVLKCYHLSVVSGPINHFELVDPQWDVSHLLMEWSGDTWRDDGPTSIRHLEIHDRKGVHRFLCQRRGQISLYNRESVQFESRFDIESVAPNPGVPESAEEIEAQIDAELEAFGALTPVAA